jgi:hypothetical protein
MKAPSEKDENLWLLVISPTIWALHFLLCYITAAIWCEKYAGPDAALGPVRTAILVYTLLAVGGIVIVGWKGYQKHSIATGKLPHDADTPEDRTAFLGFSTFLLSALSLVATLFAALVAVFFWKCY